MSIDFINEVLVVCVKWLVVSLVVMVLVGRSRNSSAKVLQGVLMAALVCLLLLPLMSLHGPAWQVPLLPKAFGAWLSLPVVWGEPGGRLLMLAACLWLSVCAYLLGQLIWNVTRAYRLVHCSRLLNSGFASQVVREHSVTLHLRRPVKLYSSDDTDSPITLGALFPVIILPSTYVTWSDACVRRFLIHELAHIRRFDWLQKLAGQTIVALLWFMPGAWWLSKRAQWYAELACDDMVVMQGGNRHDYALDLLRLGEQLQRPVRGSIALIDGSMHFQRVDALLDSSRIRVESNRKYGLYIVILLIASLVFGSIKLGIKAPLFAEMTPTLIVASVTANDVDAISNCDGGGCSAPVELLDRQWLQPSPPPHIQKPRVHSVLREPVNDEDIAVLPEPINLPLLSKSLFPSHRVRMDSVKPVYPVAALRRNLEGRVSVTFDVFADGSTGNITIIERSGKPVFDNAVVAAVQKFRYQALEANQLQKISSITERFEFRIIEDAETEAK